MKKFKIILQNSSFVIEGKYMIICEKTGRVTIYGKDVTPTEVRCIAPAFACIISLDDTQINEMQS